MTNRPAYARRAAPVPIGAGVVARVRRAAILLFVSLTTPALAENSSSLEDVVLDVVQTCRDLISSEDNIAETLAAKGFIFPEGSAREDAAELLAYRSRVGRSVSSTEVPNQGEFEQEHERWLRHIESVQKISFWNYLVHPEYAELIIESSEGPKRYCAFTSSGEYHDWASLLGFTDENSKALRHPFEYGSEIAFETKLVPLDASSKIGSLRTRGLSLDNDANFGGTDFISTWTVTP